MSSRAGPSLAPGWGGMVRSLLGFDGQRLLAVGKEGSPGQTKLRPVQETPREWRDGASAVCRADREWRDGASSVCRADWAGFPSALMLESTEVLLPVPCSPSPPPFAPFMATETLTHPPVFFEHQTPH